MILYKRNQNCCTCNIRLDKVSGVTRIGVMTLEKTRFVFENQTIALNDPVCSKCRNKIAKIPFVNNQQNDDSTSDSLFDMNESASSKSHTSRSNSRDSIDDLELTSGDDYPNAGRH